ITTLLQVLKSFLRFKRGESFLPHIITSYVFITSAPHLTYDLKPFRRASAPMLIRMVFLSVDKLNRLSQAVLSVLILKFWAIGIQVILIMSAATPLDMRSNLIFLVAT